MDAEAWWAAIYGIAQSRTRLKRLSSSSSSLTFRSLIHFEFIFVYGVRMFSNFILLHVAVQFSNGTPLQYSCLENPMVGGAW